jgi:chemosensory pili system protein ChpA (sensor histidine kinase/response regulator)
MKLLELPEQTPATDLDEEIIDIFVEEAKEVMEEISANYDSWKDNLADSEALHNLRRAFHTLKGSGRLVGAMVIGELGWRFESMLNRVIEGSLAPNDKMLFLIARVPELLPDMIHYFKNDIATPHDVILLVSQADCLTRTHGESLGDFDSPADQTSPSPAEKSTAPATKPPIPRPSSENSRDFKPPTDMPIPSPVEKFSAPVTKQPIVAPTVPAKPPVIGEPLEKLLEPEIAAEIEQLGEFPDEFAEEMGLEFPDISNETWQSAESELATTEVENFSDTPDELADNLLAAHDELPEFGELPTLDSEDLSNDGFSELHFAETSETSIDFVPLDEDEVEVELEELPDLNDFNAPLTPPPAPSPAPFSHFHDDEENEPIDPVLFEIYKAESLQHLETLQEFLTHITLPAQVTQDLIRAFHTLNGSSRSVKFTEISNIAGPMESYARYLQERKNEITAENVNCFKQATDFIKSLLAGEPVDQAMQQALLNAINVVEIDDSLFSMSKTVSPAKSSESKQVAKSMEDMAVPSDEFMDIFLEEAEEILENTQSLLERWQSTPNNMQLMKELQRELHTLKGGSRMVGISQMGNLSHQLESVLTKIVEGNAQTNPKLQEIVQTSVDELASMLERVKHSEPLENPDRLIAQIDAALTGEVLPPEPKIETLQPAVVLQPSVEPKKIKPQVTEEVEVAPKLGMTEKNVDKTSDKAAADKAEKDEMAEGGEDRIRVRVTLIDKLTNLAGELSILRAHLEQQQAAVKNNISEMEQTVVRLRDQLRRLEMETETQIISHFREVEKVVAQPLEHHEFDLLELDRFSLMQQLSRSLMESISDLVSIQDYLKTLSRQTDTLLIQQSRVGAELQDSIMRTRMIPFSRISPRLQRITRLTARELHKQIDFVVNGEEIEFERTVLNRMVAPLEHMLRNAIGHGVEEVAVRQQSGKPPTARVIIDISKESTDLIIKMSDDGAGLNLPVIRKKAEERGMIQPGAVVSDHELMQFILEPSFSTAKAITQVSGRGVGMDVANSEIKQLSGSLMIHSKMGKGTTFEIRLPLSLTINQALLVHVGEETLAVPMNHVDAVMRVPRHEVQNADGVIATEPAHYYKYMDNEYRVSHLGDLLGFPRVATPDTPLIPTLLVRNGDKRIALLVDGIEGSKEIVVKSVGPQIGAIRWITGATILGDGRVVLILDISTITRVDTLPQYDQMLIQDVVVEEKKPVAKTIMVVDDSITVRKVTARLLKRQGMDVITAKDGVDAIAQLQERIPDLMLLDVEMPRMDGYELAKQVRNTAGWTHIPIIMITSRTGAKHREHAEKIGINRYLGKPFNETELLENIHALLENRPVALMV